MPKTLQLAHAHTEAPSDDPDFTPAPAGPGLTPAAFARHGRGRLGTAISVSLLLHGLLLSLSVGGHALGLPGFTLPWKERRLGADDLRVVLAPAQPAAPAAVTPAPAPPASAPAAIPLPSPEPAPAPEAPAPATPEAPARVLTAVVPAQESGVPESEQADTLVRNRIDQEAQEQARTEARRVEAAQSAERLRQIELAADAQREAAWRLQREQEAVRAGEAARIDAARLESERQESVRQEALRREARQLEEARAAEQAQQHAALQEIERAEAARLEQARQAEREAALREQARLAAARNEQAQLDAARQEAARQEATRQELARQEAARQEAARQEAERQEAAHREAARQEAARQELVRQEAARQEAASQEAARQEAARQAAARQEAAKQEAARQAAASQEAARQEQARQEQAQRERAAQEAQREERLRAIGQQMKQEAAQRDAAVPPPATGSLRRGWLFGRADPNTDLVLYAQAMSRKIEMNLAFDTVREVVKQPHTQPIVTVAIRADGSVEKVTFVVSSGVPAIDEAIRQVVASHAPYGAFPPALARQYDVVEIRRTWIFDMAIRLQ
jgi:hypothetical protein